MQAVTAEAGAIAARVEHFVREHVVSFEQDPRNGGHGPSEDLVTELRAAARAAGILTPHILPDGSHLSQRDTACVLKAAGLSPPIRAVAEQVVRNLIAAYAEYASQK